MVLPAGPHQPPARPYPWDTPERTSQVQPNVDSTCTLKSLIPRMWNHQLMLPLRVHIFLSTSCLCAPHKCIPTATGIPFVSPLLIIQHQECPATTDLCRTPPPATATITKYHIVASLNNKNLFSDSSSVGRVGCVYSLNPWLIDGCHLPVMSRGLPSVSEPKFPIITRTLDMLDEGSY